MRRLLLLALLTASALPAAELANLDFARQHEGVIPDKVASRPSAMVDTLNAYGRLRGACATPSQGARYAAPAMGRSGELDALRLGDAGHPLRLPGRLFQTGKPFAVEAWVWLYGARKPGEEIHHYGGALLTAGANYYQHGWRLNTNSRWAPHGWLGLMWYPENIQFSEFSPGKWHQLVVSNDSTTVALYVDGGLVGQKTAAIKFDDHGLPGGELVVGGEERLDFKLDQLTVHDCPLSDADVKDHYLKGKPSTEFPAGLEERLTGLKLEIPHDNYGYFVVGQKIPVSTNAAELLVDGASQPPRTELSFAEPGLREVQFALADHGKILRRETYPLAIIPFAMKSSKLGALELASQRPELSALGVKLSRLVVNWRELEPVKRDYDWARLDAMMKRNRELGVETILCLTGVPVWAKLPRDMAAYVKLWRLLANRYDNVKLFEVWNATNPNNSLGREAYLPLLRAAAETLRQEVPDAKILAGRIDISDGLANAAWLQKEATAWHNIFSGRKYPAQDAWAVAITKATAKPVWNTGGGVHQTLAGTTPPKSWPLPTFDEETAAAWLIQDLALQLADGVERIVLEAGPSDYVPAGSAQEGLPGKEGLALAVFNGLVGKDAKLSRLPDVPAGLTAVRFANPAGRKGLILFTSGATVELKEMKCLDFDKTQKRLEAVDSSNAEFPCGGAALECCDSSQLYADHGHDSAVVSALKLSPETSSAYRDDRAKAAINRSTPKTLRVGKTAAPPQQCQQRNETCLDLFGKSAAPVATGRPLYVLDVENLNGRK